MTEETGVPPAVTQSHPKLLELLPKLKSLEDALLTKDPKMNEHLKEIHTYLIQFEELSHLLKEEQIAVILGAQQMKLGIILANETKKTGGGKVKAGKISAEEL